MTTLRRRVLVVENDPERLAEFKRHFGPTMVAARRYGEATKALSKYDFDEVWLDFDIAGRRNGSDVAYCLTRMRASRRPARVICHSTNLRGRFSVVVTPRRSGLRVDERP